LSLVQLSWVGRSDALRPARCYKTAVFKNLQYQDIMPESARNLLVCKEIIQFSTVSFIATFCNAVVINSSNLVG